MGEKKKPMIYAANGARISGLRQVFPDRFKNQGLKKGLAF